MGAFAGRDRHHFCVDRFAREVPTADECPLNQCEKVCVGTDRFEGETEPLPLLRGQDEEVETVGEIEHLGDEIGFGVVFSKRKNILYDLRIRTKCLPVLGRATNHGHRREEEIPQPAGRFHGVRVFIEECARGDVFLVSAFGEIEVTRKFAEQVREHQTGITTDFNECTAIQRDRAPAERVRGANERRQFREECVEFRSRTERLRELHQGRKRRPAEDLGRFRVNVVLGREFLRVLGKRIENGSAVEHGDIRNYLRVNQYAHAMNRT